MRDQSPHTQELIPSPPYTSESGLAPRVLFKHAYNAAERSTMNARKDSIQRGIEEVNLNTSIEISPCSQKSHAACLLETDGPLLR